MQYVTSLERFQRGDFPDVCVRSGLPSTKIVLVEAAVSSPTWPWLFLPISLFWFVVAKWTSEEDNLWGQLPFAEGHVDGVTATYDKKVGVIVEGVHPSFVKATEQQQVPQ